MKRSKMIVMKVYKPESTAGKEELARHVSGIHSELVNRRINQLPCSNKQKQHLLDAVIAEAKKQASAEEYRKCKEKGINYAREDREKSKDI